MTNMNGFVSWEMLKTEALSPHYCKVIDDWRALLSDDTLTEPAYLKFLHEHSGFFFHDDHGQLLSISEFEFGADLRADFVVCNDRASYGFEYEFIEVESPWDAVFTRKGVPSPSLTEAMNQIQRWRLWLDANRPEAKRIVPSKSFVVADQPAFKYTIIIGRRQEKDPWLHLRNQLAQQMTIEIRSFDYLTDRLSRRRFGDTPIICSSEFDNLAFEVKNAIANPFATALKSATWRKLVKSPHFSSAHMIANNVEELLAVTSHNNRLAAYLSAWNSLPPETKKSAYTRAIRWA